MTSLNFEQLTPAAKQGLGLPQDHFSNGRIFATVGAHGGITALSYWGEQHLGAQHFFRGDALSAWNKLFRVALLVDGKRYYPVLGETTLFPFGLRSLSEVAGLQFQFDLLLLPDAAVQRVTVLNGPADLPIGMEMLHQEAVTAVNIAGRTWGDFVFCPETNALKTSCHDVEAFEAFDALAQAGFDSSERELQVSNTYIGVSCEATLTAHCGYHARSKHYLSSAMGEQKRVACYTVFAKSEADLDQRLDVLSRDVHNECDALMDTYGATQSQRPKIRTHSAVLDSALSQYPAIIDCLKIVDEPGAVRATASGYFVWGWDAMMSLFSSHLANDSAHTAEVLRFFDRTRDDAIGLPHVFTTKFLAYGKQAFPAQAQYICGLYLYAATTQDFNLVREVWPTCLFILNRCRKDEVSGTGLVKGTALWPDFPEAMEETGEDISSMNNSLLYQALRGMEYLAAELGESALADECRAWAVRLRKSFVQYLFDQEKGYFISSCSAVDLSPRKHYCAQAVFWLTPFAEELTSHAPARIVEFMDQHLRSAKCLLTLPHWDTAWMADGNQLGSSYPAADSFYLGVHKMMGAEVGLELWQGDVEWFWGYHTAPEAFTPEAENEHALGPDNIGTKQLQALATWYGGAYYVLAGLDFDHAGITFTPWGSQAIEISGLKLRGLTLDVKVSGAGRHLAMVKINGVTVGTASHKIAWADLGTGAVTLEYVRSDQAPEHPVIVAAHGLNVGVETCDTKRLVVVSTGVMTGELVVRTSASAEVRVNGQLIACVYDPAAGTRRLQVTSVGEMRWEILNH